MSRIEELERRVRQDPASITFGALAEEYRRAGRLDDAIRACRTGLERHPSYLSARVTLGRSLQELGQPDAARAEFEHVLSLAPDNLAAIRGMAEMHGADLPAAPAPILIRHDVREAIRDETREAIPEATPEELPDEPRPEAAQSPAPPPADVDMRSDFVQGAPDFDALDAAIAAAATSADDGATEAQRAAQIERLEIWLARLDELRHAGSRHA